jgi:hypothetical protein
VRVECKQQFYLYDPQQLGSMSQGLKAGDLVWDTRVSDALDDT